MSILYIFYFVFLYWAMIFTRQSMNIFRSETYWQEIDLYSHNLTDIQQENVLRKTYHLLYWLNADRYYWTSGDLQNLAEAFFALGNVFSICRICFLLPIIEFVGPLQVRHRISIGKPFHFSSSSSSSFERSWSNE